MIDARRGAIVPDNVTLGYDGHPAVHHLSGAFAAGSLTAVCGPNGAGKSTLLKAIAGALAPIGGRIDRVGVGRPDIAYLPQAAEIDRAFPLAVYDMAALGRTPRRGLLRALRGDDVVAAALAAVGLTGFECRQIGALSGGQTQRMLFARLMTQDARVLLLDEPFAGVDARTTRDLLALIDAWRAQGRTILAVLHDDALVRAHFPETLLLAREKIAWGPTADALSPRHLARARAMSEAFDDHAPACERVA